MYSFKSLLFLASTTIYAAPVFPHQDSVSTATVSGTGLAFFSSDLTSGAPLKAGSDYTCYSGSADSFPDISAWASFNDLWNFQVTNALSPIGDTSEEIQAMHDAVVSVGQAAQVDPRVILSVILQESTGNVNVQCTNNGVENCGIVCFPRTH